MTKRNNGRQMSNANRIARIKHEVGQLEAGRKLDALIADRIMGLNVLYVVPGSALVKEYNEWYIEDRRPEGMRYIKVPPFSTDISAAWTLFQSHYLSGQVIGSLVHDPSERPDLTSIDEIGWAREWFCTWIGNPIYAPTAPLAICRAVLMEFSYQKESKNDQA